MDLSTALETILDALGDSVAELDEPLGVIREVCMKESAEDTEDWKSKYEDLLKKYKERFVNLVTGDNKENKSGEETVLPEVNPLTFDDINMFDGSTE
jgi:hypothetical protein